MKLGIEPVERGANVFEFAAAAIVLALAEACAAEVETQHGETKTVQGLHGVEDNFVVQRSAEQGMRMANQRRVSGIFRARIQQGFQAAGGTVEE